MTEVNTNTSDTAQKVGDISEKLIREVGKTAEAEMDGFTASQQDDSSADRYAEEQIEQSVERLVPTVRIPVQKQQILSNPRYKRQDSTEPTSAANADIPPSHAELSVQVTQQVMEEPSIWRTRQVTASVQSSPAQAKMKSPPIHESTIPKIAQAEKHIETSSGPITSMRQYAIQKYREKIKDRKLCEQEQQYVRRQVSDTATMQSTQFRAEPTGSALPEQEYKPSALIVPKETRSVQYGKARQFTHTTDSTSTHGAKATENTIRIVNDTIRTVDQSVRIGERTVKSTETAAKATKAAAQTSAKTAQATAKASQTAAKAAAQTAKVVGQAVMSTAKAIGAALQKLIASIIAGGWVSVIVIVFIALIALIFALCFGAFSANDASEGRPMTKAIAEINEDFTDSIHAKISRYKRQYKPDEVELVYEGDTDSTGSVMNWTDVLGIYAVSTTTDPDQPSDVLIVTPEKVEILRSIFQRMNKVSYQTEVETEEIPAKDGDGIPTMDEEGNPVMDTKTMLKITICVSSMDYRNAASLYHFDDSQREMLEEIMHPDYYPLYAQLTGDVIGNGGEFGFGLDIYPDLAPSELGYQIVQAAKRYIGRSYASMDCSKFARTAYADVGLTSMNGLSSVRMAEKCREMGCLFTDPAQLQAGDLIFFARFDPSRGKDYCGDINRCGTGKCRRWLHIHHVAIYINDEYLIDSTGGDNSVQIRKLYGQNTARWKWVCFGRPTT